MRRRKASGLFLVLTGIAGILLAGLPAAAQSPDGGGTSRGPVVVARRPPFDRAFRSHAGVRFWDNPRIAAALKITPDQQKAMDNILFEHREKLIDLEATLKKAELDMEPLMNADQPSKEAIEAQIEKVVAARGALEKANANFLLAIRLKLTSDQWQQIKNFRAEHSMHMMRDRGPRTRMHVPGGSGESAPASPPAQPPSPAGGASPQ